MTLKSMLANKVMNLPFISDVFLFPLLLWLLIFLCIFANAPGFLVGLVVDGCTNSHRHTEYQRGM